MASDININTALNQQSKTLASTQSLAADFNQFLTLLTTQLQNQDPLSPMDSTEFTSQLVQFAGVEQQININQKLDSLVSLQLGNTMGNALGYVGQKINYISSEFNFDGQPVDFSYAYNGNPINAKIRIVDETGRTVFEAPANTAAGRNAFVWDGIDKDGARVPPGTYEMKIDALDADNKAVTSTIVTSGLVSGVETQNGLIFLIVGERAISLGTVLNVSQPPQPPQPPAPQEQFTLAQALQYVGKDVRYQSSSLSHEEGQSATFHYQFASAPVNAKIEIVDSSGKVVFETTAAQNTALNTYTWDGINADGNRAIDGNYQIRITGTNSQNAPIVSTVSMTGRVRGAEYSGGQAVLLIGNMQINHNAILSVMEAETT